jgi:hypothetical protein
LRSRLRSNRTLILVILFLIMGLSVGVLSGLVRGIGIAPVIFVFLPNSVVVLFQCLTAVYGIIVLMLTYRYVNEKIFQAAIVPSDDADFQSLFKSLFKVTLTCVAINFALFTLAYSLPLCELLSSLPTPFELLSNAYWHAQWLWY